MCVAFAYAIVQGASGMNAVLFYAPTVFEQIGMSVEDTFMQTVILGLVAVLFTLVAIRFVEKWGRRRLTLLGLLFISIAHTSTWYGFKSAHYEVSQEAIENIQQSQVDVTLLQPLVGKTYASDVDLKRELAGIYSKKICRW